MVKAKIYTRQKKSIKSTPKTRLRKDTGLIEYSPTQELLNEKLIAEAVWDCLKNNDPEGVVEVIEAHLDAINKVKATRKQHLPRSSLYNAFRRKNPTVRTLAKMVNCCAA